jgi:hypothetical protein
VTQGACSYETGAFHIDEGRVTETPYAAFLRALSQGAPLLIEGGWWRHADRMLYRPSRITPSDRHERQRLA